MDGFEFILFCLSIFYTFKGLKNWYSSLEHIPFRMDKTTAYSLILLPIVAFFMILYTLKVLASFDVINDMIYLIFYILLGFAWTFLGIKLVFCFFDISWIDDVYNSNNKAALYAFIGAFLGLVMIYSGANVGDGPGWWCVIFAGGLGLVSWFLLGRFVNYFTQVFERITIERDINCGFRIGAYLLSSGIILARASAGDWTSFSSTVVEFLVGWPVLILTVLVIVVERYFIGKAKMDGNNNNIFSINSLSLSLLYIIIAIASVTMFPLVENPIYDSLSNGFFGVII